MSFVVYITECSLPVTSRRNSESGIVHGIVFILLAFEICLLLCQ